MLFGCWINSPLLMGTTQLTEWIGVKFLRCLICRDDSAGKDFQKPTTAFSFLSQEKTAPDFAWAPFVSNGHFPRGKRASQAFPAHRSEHCGWDGPTNTGLVWAVSHWPALTLAESALVILRPLQMTCELAPSLTGSFADSHPYFCSCSSLATSPQTHPPQEPLSCSLSNVSEVMLLMWPWLEVILWPLSCSLSGVESALSMSRVNQSGVNCLQRTALITLRWHTACLWMPRHRDKKCSSG